MDIKPVVKAALETVLDNTWAVDLPERPAWPALLFEIDSEHEVGWCQGADYMRHTVVVIILSKVLADIQTYAIGVRQAMGSVEGYISAVESGDMDYEDDPEVYAYFINFEIRTKEF